MPKALKVPAPTPSFLMAKLSCDDLQGRFCDAGEAVVVDVVAGLAAGEFPQELSIRAGNTNSIILPDNRLVN